MKNCNNKPDSPLVLVVAGPPQPLLRPRFNSRGAFHKAYDPQQQIKEEISFEIKQQYRLPLLSGPLKLNVTFFMKIPKMSKVKSTAIIGQPHTKKPDLSNLIKFIEDVCTGIVYTDDALIHSISAKKIYDPIPRTEFYLERTK
jgi:Holliday junction resolvase RusA-like endonuclease